MVPWPSTARYLVSRRGAREQDFSPRSHDHRRRFPRRRSLHEVLPSTNLRKEAAMKNPTPTHQRATDVPASLSRPPRKSGSALTLLAAALAGAILAVAGGALYLQ